jgi:Aspartate/tyrosine/aromatic aminotransferase
MVTASRRSAIPPFIVMDVMRAADARAAAGGNVIHLEVGQPSTAAPPQVIEAARAALVTDRIGYTDALGLPALRQRIARHYGERYGVDLDWRRIVVTTGSSAAFVLAFLAAFDAGDRLAMAIPGYPAYRHIAAAFGIETVPIVVDATTRFQPTTEHIGNLATAPTGLIVASPANPTGTMLSASALAALAAFCSERRMTLISDEIYHGITYEAAATTALRSTPDAIVINSFSKYFSMTGWRIGWLVVPEPLARRVECLAQNFYISPPTLSQHAAIAAFDCEPALRENVARYARNRALLQAALPELGFPRAAPADGAFYAYVDVSAETDDSLGLSRRLLEETGVATTPGVDFDPVHGRHWLRLSYAGASAEIEEAISRLRDWRQTAASRPADCRPGTD